MGALGRILQIVGWGWLAYSFFAPMLNLPRLDFFPGVIIVFVARVLRAQAGRKRSADEESLEDLTKKERPIPQTPPPRVERKPAPAASNPAPPKPKPATPRVEETESRVTTDRDDMLEQILLAGQGLSEGTAEIRVEATDDATPAKMSSAEMIAQARKRWNKRP